MSRNAEIKRKYKRIQASMDKGAVEGQLFGKIPFFSPILGSLKGWFTETVSILKEDMARET